MKILICPDKFKESLSAPEVAERIRNGILKVMPDADCSVLPLADGGEGTARILTFATDGQMVQARVHDPLMRMIIAEYGISRDGHTAFIEMSAASGLALLSKEERNPLKTTSYGTGELIRHALDRNCSEIVIGIGGSATIDGGVGMAQALGVSLKDADGREIPAGGSHLGQIKTIDLSELDKRIRSSRILVACDVINVLWGREGAARVFGSQKGADREMVETLDEGLRNLALVIKNELNMDVEGLPGGGAAGGLGAGLAAFTGGKIMKGFHLIAGYLQLEEHIKHADLIITGEGKMDGQTLMGKTPAGVAEIASKYHKPVIAFTGWIEDEHHIIQHGFKAVIPIADKPMSLSESMFNAPALIENAAERTFRLYSGV